MIKITDPKDCCGCGTCSLVCPKQCITMGKDRYGFVFPKVNEEQCINCGACNNVCPIENKPLKEIKQTAYVAYTKDDQLRFQSASGGMFGTFARKVLSKGGVVYGAAFDESNKLRMARLTSADDLKPLLKSKYIQSDCRSAFGLIRTDLEDGEQVLVCSTPCQIAALRNYLKKDYNNLVLIDIFCHGVPSQEFFDKCLDYLERKNGIKIESYEFRTKVKNGSTNYYYTLGYTKNGQHKEKVGLYLDDPYFTSFEKHISIRESCYACRYADRNRVGDITIGDFHEIDKYVSGINRFDGVSTLITNNSKGEELLKECAGTLNLVEVDLDKMIENKDCFAGPAHRSAKRDEFMENYATLDFDTFVDKSMTLKKDQLKGMYYRMPTLIRMILKKVLIRE
ncbi:MAG: Coenzyme F420 hydrogenase/dehydrogenase, beta subunit C-terminal domain [Erysipelotrichaceae bacterium]|nr:Coenzyme F420 hydrogenase/dehydrogenase, beta subunit C-terminal domain [Erysipelotrichaceae bacterium]